MRKLDANKKVSACKKYKQHRGTAQQALLKHLLVTALFGRNKDRQKAARMRLRSASATLGRKKKSFVFATTCKKYKEIQGRAKKALLKHLLVTGHRMRKCDTAHVKSIERYGVGPKICKRNKICKKIKNKQTKPKI